MKDCRTITETEIIEERLFNKNTDKVNNIMLFIEIGKNIRLIVMKL